jgi:hypothetical protein
LATPDQVSFALDSYCSDVYSAMTIGELQDWLGKFSRDYEIFFSGHPGLKFYRLKQRGDKLVQMEFAENVYKDEHGKWCVDDPEDFIPLGPNRPEYTGQ